MGGSHEALRGKKRETGTVWPLLTHSFSFFAGPRNPTFWSSAPKGRTAQAQWASVAPRATRKFQCACAEEVFINLQPRLFWGCFFWGVSAGAGTLAGSL